MYTPLVLLAALVGARAISYQALVQEQWEQFKLEHDKIYQSEDEEQYRLRVFMDNLHKINQHNKLYEMGLKTYRMAMNHFGDLPKEEFLRLYTVNMPELPQTENASASELWSDLTATLPQSMQDFFIHAPPANLDDLKDLPGDIDWREKGAVTPVKNQGACGSCWSFSAAGALEAQWFRKHSNLVPLSEQNLVDCSRAYGNLGCGGGWMHWAFRYIHDNGGIDTEASYSYTAKDGQCRYNPGNKGATVSKWVLIHDEKELELTVGGITPVSVAAEVSHDFQFYREGVYDEPKCGHQLNHAMLAVGYGSLGGKYYWLVKNSWGTGWGDHGYILMSRNKGNQCGIASMASYPVV